MEEKARPQVEPAHTLTVTATSRDLWTLVAWCKDREPLPALLLEFAEAAKGCLGRGLVNSRLEALVFVEEEPAATNDEPKED